MNDNERKINELYDEILELHRTIARDGISENEQKNLRKRIHSKTIAIQRIEQSENQK